MVLVMIKSDETYAACAAGVICFFVHYCWLPAGFADVPTNYIGIEGVGNVIQLVYSKKYSEYILKDTIEKLLV